MKFKMALLTFVFSTWIVNTYGSVEMCFRINGQTGKRTFKNRFVTFQDARESLKLTENDNFKRNGILIERQDEDNMLVKSTECYEVINQNGKSSVRVCILNDICTNFTLPNSAKVNTLRANLFNSLPRHYKDENCANIVFYDKNGKEIQRSEEENILYQNILKNGYVQAYNTFIDNTTELDIIWLLNKYQVRVNMLSPLRLLRNWITNPSGCPNLKGKLNLPEKPLFPNPEKPLARNWKPRDKYVELDKVPSSRVVDTQLVAPFDKEMELTILSYTYNTENSNVRRIYYVNTAEENKVAFAGTRTKVFEENNLQLSIASRSPKEMILLPMKDVRSTNNRAVAWTNVVIATNNTAVTLTAKWMNHKMGVNYRCELFDFREKNTKHYLYNYVSENGICKFKYIHDKDTGIWYDLLFNREELIENASDMYRFRYEIGVAMYPHRAGHWSCTSRRRRETKYEGNIDITQDQITMGGAGIGDNVHKNYEGSCILEDDVYAEENKRLLYFNLFIFKSKEISEKIIEDVPVF